MESDVGAIQGITWEDESCYLLLNDVVTIGGQTWYGLCLDVAALEGDTLTVREIHPLEAIEADTDGLLELIDTVARDGQVYLLLNKQQDGLGVNSLWRVDAETGECRKLMTGWIHHLNLWRDGMLLVQNNDGFSSLSAVDVQTGRLSEVLALEGSLEDAAPAYDAVNDTLYFLQNGLLMRWNGDGAPEACAVTGLAPDVNDAGQAVICGNEYVILRDGKVYAFPTNGEMPQQMELSVEGHSIEPALVDLFSGFSTQRTDVRCTAMGGWMGREGIAQRLITHDPLPDIYHAYSDMGYYNMARKGFFVDLSDLESVSALVDSMEPAVQALVKREDGALIGLPVELRDTMSLSLNYNRKVLHAIGLTEDDLPRTLEELLDFIEMWSEEITTFEDGMHGTYALFDGSNDTFRTLVNTFLNTQLATLNREGKPLTLDNPALQQALRRLEGMRDRLPEMERGAQNVNRLLLSLFESVSLSLTNGDQDNYQPLFLSVDEDHDPVYPVSVRVMVINPYASASQQAVAKDFLTYTAENLNAWERIKLCPDYSTPQFREDFPEEWEKAAAAVDEARADLEIAPEESRKTFEERLERAEAELERVEATRYAISPERIASIHAMSADFVPLLRTFEDTTAGSELLSRYIAGDIGTDAFLTQMERVLRMQEEEDR